LFDVSVYKKLEKKKLNHFDLIKIIIITWPFFLLLLLPRLKKIENKFKEIKNKKEEEEEE
jgi:hypothetical protein